MKRRFLMICIVLIGCLQGSLNARSEQQAIPLPGHQDTAELRILVDTEDAAFTRDVLSAHVLVHRSESDFAEIELPIAGHAVSSAAAALDKPIEIQAGYHGVMQTLFAGRCISQRIVARKDASDCLVLHCENPVKKGLYQNPDRTPVLTLMYKSTVLDFDILREPDHVIHGDLWIKGTADSVLDRYVELQGFPAGFNRLVRVQRVEHQWRSKEWTTGLNVVSD